MLNFTVEKKTLNLGKRKGQQVYYAKQVDHQKLPLSVIVERISASTSLATSDVHAAIIALSEVVHQELSQGRSVDLGQLGLFKVGISAKMMDRPEEVTAATLRTPRVRFFPKDGMRQAARAVLLSVQKRGQLSDGKAEGGGSTSGNGSGGAGAAGVGTGGGF